MRRRRPRTGAALLAAGAHVLDVGGQTGQMGAEIGVELEIERVVPVVERLGDACVSVDTYRAPVAEAALAAGASFVNDYTGGHDPELAGVVAAAGAGPGGHALPRPAAREPVPLLRGHRWTRCCGSSRPPQRGPSRPAWGSAPCSSTRASGSASRRASTWRSCATWTASGRSASRCWRPCSHKEFTADASGLPEDDLLGTATAAALAARAGVAMVRLHDVAELVPVLRLADAIRTADGP